MASDGWVSTFVNLNKDKYEEEYKKESKHFVLQIEQGSHMIAIADRASAGSGTAVNHTEINILQLLAILEEYRLTTQSSTTAADICTILKIWSSSSSSVVGEVKCEMWKEVTNNRTKAV